MQYVRNNFDTNQPTLVIPNYYGTPYMQYGLFYGMAWSGNDMRLKYAVELKKLFPNIYFYHNWNNLFNQWDNSYTFLDLLKKYKNIVLFSGDIELENSLFGKLHGINRQFDTKIRKINSFELTDEIFYDVTFDSRKEMQSYRFTFDAEIRDSSKQFFLNSDHIKIGNANTQSSDFAKSGMYSSKLTKESPYGMTAYLSEVEKGEHFKLSVWRYDNKNDDANLVVTSNNPDKFYYSINQPVSTEKGWQKLEFDFVVPEFMQHQDIKIYCWNKIPVLPAYFDDISIEKIVQ